jgi:tetratricopeptide (TPR) repeat protein
MTMKPVLNRVRMLATGAVLLLCTGIVAPAVFAAEVRALDDPNLMSRELGARLGPIFTMHDAGQLNEAAAAMQQLRADFDNRLSDYEKLRVLQTSGILNNKLGKVPEALADYEAILQISDLPADVRLSTSDILAQLYTGQSDWTKAVEHLLVVNELQTGTNKETLFRLAFAYAQGGDAAAAVPFMEQALALAGEAADEQYYRNLAAIYVQAKEPLKAIDTYEKYLELFPDSPNREVASANLATLYIEVRDNDSARNMLRNLIRLYPRSERMATYRQSLAALGG